jgi:hypothetical protein
MLEGLGSFDTPRMELLNPKDRSDSFDPESQPDYVPKGYSTSNDVDGLSFAQGSGLERSAVFAAGSGTVWADELTHHGDILFFSGLSGVRSARITFAIRDRLANVKALVGGYEAWAASGGAIER